MVKLCFDVLVCLLAVYGGLSLLISIVNTVSQRMNFENTQSRLVLMVKDQEEVIEGAVRNIFVGDFLRKVMSSENLIVVDMGSTDRTMDILKKLKCSYEHMDVLRADEKENVFTYFE